MSFLHAHANISISSCLTLLYFDSVSWDMADILCLCVFCGWNDDIKLILVFALWDLRAQAPEGETLCVHS